MLDHMRSPGVWRRHTLARRQADASAVSSAAGGAGSGIVGVPGSTDGGATSTGRGGAGAGSTAGGPDSQSTSQQQQQSSTQQQQPSTTQRQQSTTSQAAPTSSSSSDDDSTTSSSPSTTVDQPSTTSSDTPSIIPTSSLAAPTTEALPTLTPLTSAQAPTSSAINLSTSVQVVTGNGMSFSSSAQPSALNNAGPPPQNSGSGLSTPAIAAISVVSALAGVAILFWLGVQIANSKRRQREAAEMGEIDFDPSNAGGGRSGSGSNFGDDPLHDALGITRSASGHDQRDLAEGVYEDEEEIKEREQIYADYMKAMAPPASNAPLPPGLTRQPTAATMLSRQPTSAGMYHHASGPSNASSGGSAEGNYVVGGATGDIAQLQRQNTVMTTASSNGGVGLSRQPTVGAAYGAPGMAYGYPAAAGGAYHQPTAVPQGYYDVAGYGMDPTAAAAGYHPGMVGQPSDHMFQQYQQPMDAMRFHSTSPVANRSGMTATPPSRELYNPRPPSMLLQNPTLNGAQPLSSGLPGSRPHRRSLRNYNGIPAIGEGGGPEMGAGEMGGEEWARHAMQMGAGMTRSESVGTAKEDFNTGYGGNLRLVEH